MAGFSEEDARRIFARAAERQGADDAPGDELSLAELQAIGEASGIDPAHVAAAAAELRSDAARPPAGGFLGVPALVQETRVLPVALSDEAWARIVEDLRATFRHTGVATDIGHTREWTDGRLSGRDGLHVTARPLDTGGTEIVAQHSLETNAQALRVLTAVFGVLVVVMTVLGAVSGAPRAWLFGPLMALVLSFAVALPVWLLRRNARHAERAFGPLLDRAELTARDAADRLDSGGTALEESAPSEPRLDLPPDETPAAPLPHRPRRRAR